jgi:hypothetical protein
MPPRRPAVRPTPGTIVRAEDIPEDLLVVVRTLHTHQVGVVVKQIPGHGCVLDFGEERPVTLHGRVFLEVLE